MNAGIFKSLRKGLLATASLLVLAGCSGVADRFELEADYPAKHAAVNNIKLAPPITTLEVDGTEFWSVEESTGDPLPDTLIGPLTTNETNVGDLLDLIAQHGNIAVIRGAVPEDITITYRDPGKRKLSEIVDVIAKTAGLFYVYEDKLLRFTDQRRFFVRVPRIKNEVSVYEEIFENLGASEISANDTTGVISFDANRISFASIKQYMKKFEEGRDMISYDIYVLERSLNKDRQAGLAVAEIFDNVGKSSGTFAGLKGSSEFTLGGREFSAAGKVINNAPAMLGLISDPFGFDLGMLFSLLETEGFSNAIQKPNLSAMSGQNAEFIVGDDVQYVKQITRTTDSNGVDDFSSEVDKVTIGTTLIIGGSHHEGIINMGLNIAISSLLRFEEFSVGDGESVKLPQTAKRELKTTLDMRPGDVMMIGGLITERVTDSQDLLYRTGIPFGEADTDNKTETVILIRPRVIQFRSKKIIDTNSIKTGYLIDKDTNSFDVKDEGFKQHPTIDEKIMKKVNEIKASVKESEWFEKDRQHQKQEGSEEKPEQAEATIPEEQIVKDIKEIVWEEEWATYVVKKGDFLSKIAKSLGVSTTDLAKENGIKEDDLDKIVPGQKLRYRIAK